MVRGHFGGHGSGRICIIIRICMSRQGLICIIVNINEALWILMRYDVMKIGIFWNLFVKDRREKSWPRQNQFSNNRLLIDLLIDLSWYTSYFQSFQMLRNNITQLWIGMSRRGLISIIANINEALWIIMTSWELKFYGIFFFNDRREKIDGRIGDIDAKKNQKRGIDRWRHVSLEF